MLKVAENREEIISILTNTKRKGIKKLLERMDQDGFFDSPCSGGFHLCEKGGLAEHTLNVYRYAHIVAQAILTPEEYEQKKEAITIASLLHDLGKMGDFNKPGYVPNLLKSGKASATKPFKVNSDLLAVPHSVRSVKIASEFIELNEDEAFAILYHDGLYGELKYTIQGHETPLYFIIHTADFWVARFVEDDTGGNDAPEN